MVKIVTSSGEYYAYELAYPDGIVFYVGKGKGNRIDQHEAEARRGKQSYKCNVIRQIWRDGGQVLKRKVQENMSEEVALAFEIDLIRMYGREHLTNGTDGGEGGACIGAGRPNELGESRLISFDIAAKDLALLDKKAGKGNRAQFIREAIQEKVMKGPITTFIEEVCEVAQREKKDMIVYMRDKKLGYSDLPHMPYATHIAAIYGKPRTCFVEIDGVEEDFTTYYELASDIVEVD